MIEEWVRFIVRLGKAILTNMGLLLLLTLLFMAIQGNWSLASFSDATFWSGALAIVVGLLSLAGGWFSTRSFPYQYGASAGLDDVSKRARQTADETHQNAGFFVRMGAAGLIMMMLSALFS